MSFSSFLSVCFISFYISVYFSVLVIQLDLFQLVTKATFVLIKVEFNIYIVFYQL